MDINKIDTYKDNLRSVLGNVNQVDSVIREAEHPENTESISIPKNENLSENIQKVFSYKPVNINFTSKFSDSKFKEYLNKLKSNINNQSKQFKDILLAIESLKQHHKNILNAGNISKHYNQTSNILEPILKTITPKISKDEIEQYDLSKFKDYIKNYKQYSNKEIIDINNPNNIIKEAFDNRSKLLRKYIFQNLVANANKKIIDKTLKNLKEYQRFLKNQINSLKHGSKVDPQIIKELKYVEESISNIEKEYQQRLVRADEVAAKFEGFDTDIKRHMGTAVKVVQNVEQSLKIVGERLIKFVDKSLNDNFNLKRINNEILFLNNKVNECIQSTNRLTLTHGFFDLDSVILTISALTVRQMVFDASNKMLTLAALRSMCESQSGPEKSERVQIAKALYKRSKNGMPKINASNKDEYIKAQKNILEKSLKKAYADADKILEQRQKAFQQQLDSVGLGPITSHNIVSDITHTKNSNGEYVFKGESAIKKYSSYFEKHSAHGDVVDRLAKSDKSNKKWSNEEVSRIEASFKAGNEAKVGQISKDSVAALASTEKERTDSVPNNSGVNRLRNLAANDKHVLSRNKLIKNNFDYEHNYKDINAKFYTHSDYELEKTTLVELRRQLSRMHESVKTFDNTELLAYQQQLSNGLVQLSLHAADSAIAAGRLLDLNQHPKYEDVSATMKHIESSRKGMVEAATTLLQNASFLVKYIVAQKGVSETFDKMSNALKEKLESDLRKARLEFNDTGNIATLEKYEYQAKTYMQKMPQSQEFILLLAGSVNNISKDAKEALEKVSELEKSTRNGVGKFLQKSRYGSNNLSQRSASILAANGASIKTINSVTGNEAIKEDILKSVLNDLTSTLKKTLDYPELVSSFDVLFRSLGRLILRVINTSDIQFKSLSIINSVLKARLGDTTIRQLQNSFLNDMKAILTSKKGRLKVSKISDDLFMARGIWECFNVDKRTLKQFIENFSKNPGDYSDQAINLFGDKSIAAAAIPFITERDAQFNSYIETIKSLKEFNLKNITSNHVETLISNASFIIKTLSEELPLKPFKSIKDKNKQQDKDSEYREAEHYIISHFKELTGETFDSDNEFHQRELARLTEKRFRLLRRIKKLDTTAKWGIGFFFSDDIRKELRRNITDGIKNKISDMVPTKFKKGWAVGASVFTFKEGYFRNIYDTVQKSHKEFGTEQQKFLQAQRDELLNLEKRKPSKLASAKGSTLNKLDDAVHSQNERNRLLSLINKNENEIPLKDRDSVAELKNEISGLSQQHRDVLLGQEIATAEMDPELIKVTNQVLEDGGIESTGAAQELIKKALKTDQEPGESKASRLSKANWLGGIISSGLRLKNAAERANNRDLKDSAERAVDATNRMSRALIMVGDSITNAFKRKNTPIIENTKTVQGAEIPKLGEAATPQESSSGSWLTWLLAGLTALLALFGVQWTDLVHFWLMLLRLKKQLFDFLSSPFKWLVNGLKNIIKTPFKWLYNGILKIFGVSPEWFGNLKAWFKGGIGGFFSKWLINPIKSFLKNTWGFLFGGPKKLASHIWSLLEGKVAGVVGSAVQGILKLLGMGKNLIPDILKGGSKLTSSAIKAAKDSLGKLGSKATDIAKDAAESIKGSSLINGAVEGAKKMLNSGSVKSVKDAAQKLSEQARNFGSTIGETMKKLTEDATSWWGKVKGWVGKAVGFITGATTTVKNVFVKGIEKVQEVGGVIKSKLTECWSAFKTRFDSFKDIIKDAISNAGDILKNKAKMIIACIPPKIRAMCTKLFNGLKRLSKAIVQSVSKNAAKSAGKKIPVIGLVFSAIGAYQRIRNGEYVKAILEVVSGICSILPGPGTAASLLIDAGLIAWDVVDIVSGDKGKSGEASDDKSDSTDKVNNAEQEQQSLVGDFVEGVKSIDADKVASEFQKKWKELNSMTSKDANAAVQKILNDSEMGDMMDSDEDSLNSGSAAPKTKQQQYANSLVKNIGADNISENVNKAQKDLANSTNPNSDKSKSISLGQADISAKLRELKISDIDPVDLYNKLKDLGVLDTTQIAKGTLAYIAEAYRNKKLTRDVLEKLVKKQSDDIKNNLRNNFERASKKEESIDSDRLKKYGLSGFEVGGSHGSKDLTGNVYSGDGKGAEKLKIKSDEGKKALSAFISNYFTNTIWFPSQYKSNGDSNGWAAFMSGDSKPYHSFIIGLENTAGYAQDSTWKLIDGSIIKNKIIENLGNDGAEAFANALTKAPNDRTPLENAIVYRVVSNGWAHPNDYSTMAFMESNALDGGSKVGDDKTSEFTADKRREDANSVNLGLRTKKPNITINNIDNVSYNYNYFKNNSKQDVDSFYDLAKKGYGVNDKGEVIVKNQKALDDLKSKMGDQFNGGNQILKDYIKSTSPGPINLPSSLSNYSGQSDVDKKLQDAAKDLKEIAKDAQKEIKGGATPSFIPAGSPDSEAGVLPTQPDNDCGPECKAKIDNALDQTKKKLEDLPPDQRAAAATAMASSIPSESIPALDSLKNNENLVSQFGASVEDSFELMKGLRYQWGGKSIAGSGIDCSGYVRATLQRFIQSKPTIDGKPLSDDEAKKVWNDIGLARAIGSISMVDAMSKTGAELKGYMWSEITPDMLKEGDVLYEDWGQGAWGQGSGQHIMFVHNGYMYESSSMGRSQSAAKNKREGYDASWDKNGVRKIPLNQYVKSRKVDGSGLYKVRKNSKRLMVINIFDALVRATKHTRGEKVDGWNQKDFKSTLGFTDLSKAGSVGGAADIAGSLGSFNNIGGNILDTIQNMPGFGTIATKLVNALFGGGASTANETINRVKDTANKIPKDKSQPAESEPSIPDVSTMLNNNPNAAQLARDVKSKQNKLEIEQKIQNDNNLKKSVDTITTKKIQEEKEKEIQKQEEQSMNTDTNYDGTTKVSLSFKEKVKLSLKKMFITSPVIEAAMA